MLMLTTAGTLMFSIRYLQENMRKLHSIGFSDITVEEMLRVHRIFNNSTTELFNYVLEPSDSPASSGQPFHIPTADTAKLSLIDTMKQAVPTLIECLSRRSGTLFCT
jgi:hypothetical protein